VIRLRELAARRDLAGLADVIAIVEAPTDG
jgi:hypothetical protein